MKVLITDSLEKYSMTTSITFFKHTHMANTNQLNTGKSTENRSLRNLYGLLDLAEGMDFVGKAGLLMLVGGGAILIGLRLVRAGARR